MNIAVLLGGISPERNISMVSGRAAVSALRELGHTVVAIDPSRGASGRITDEELAAATPREVQDSELASFRTGALLECVNSTLFDNIDLAFILLHGRYGEDGYMQGLLDLRGIPYTGSTMTASAIAMDKGLSKMLFQASGIPTPPWISLTKSDADDETVISDVIRELKGACVVKPNDQGSTVGMTILESPTTDTLAEAVRTAASFSSVVLVERYIAGRELTVAVLGSEALPIIEIVPKQGYYDYENKYTKGRTEYHCPAEVSEEVADHVCNLAIAAHHVLGCRAYSRVDFRLSEENVPYCLEVNTIPGFTETSLVPMAAKAQGMSFPELCEEIIRLSAL